MLGRVLLNGSNKKWIFKKGKWIDENPTFTGANSIVDGMLKMTNTGSVKTNKSYSGNIHILVKAVEACIINFWTNTISDATTSTLEFKRTGVEREFVVTHINEILNLRLQSYSGTQNVYIAGIWIEPVGGNS